MKTIRFHCIIGLLCLSISTVGFSSSYSLFAVLSGSEEVPEPGDPDGYGFALIIPVERAQKICWLISARNIETATSAHIHQAPIGEAGPVVVSLSPPDDGLSFGCAEDVDDDLISDIINNPQEYYVNVHNEEYPDGALRGQLGD